MIAVRDARPGDGAAIHAMVRALAEHHGAVEHFEAEPGDYEAMFFGPHPHVGAALASFGSEPAGCAIWHRSFSSFRGREVMYMEDLSVLPQFRQRGVGQALLRHVARLAVARNCPAIGWLMMDWNAEGRALYEKVGAEIEPGVNFCRLHGEALARLAT